MNDSDVRAIQRAYPRIYAACHRRHRPRGTTEDSLSPRDEQLLAHLDLERGASPSELARHLAIGLPTMSEALDRLEDAGLIGRTRAAGDRRKVQVRLTARGDRLSRAQSVLDEELVTTVLQAMKPTERRRAVEGLELLAEACGRITRSRRSS